ncbi:DMP19 family protein [Pseudomonas paraeruginosa]|uniref:DMP19 family protein n=1 Tax=Pseudomonas paraeruginosa TaxID=2994495 RepID=UPI0034D7AD70
MTDRLPCRACGHLILPVTAARNDGLCMPCQGGYRQNIEDGKRFHEQRRRYLESPRALYWSALVTRVHGDGAGFAGLSPAEQTYFAVSVLSGEVNNGGFDQYFGNSSGDQYPAACAGLRELQAEEALALLERAATLLFGNGPVPGSQAERQLRMPTWAEDPDRDCEAALDALDTRFYALADALDERLLAHARRHALFAQDETDEA